MADGRIVDMTGDRLAAMLLLSIAKMWCLTSREGLEALAADSVGR